MVAFGPVPIASTQVLDRLRINLSLTSAPARPANLRLLSYTNYFQRRQFWCWAAVAKSIARFYHPSTPLTQCQIADAHARPRGMLCRGVRAEHVRHADQPRQGA